jgi:hypothetical protein
MGAFKSACLALTAILAVPPALAQEKTKGASDGSEIVVKGDRDRDRQVRRFVEALTPSEPYRGQIGRFELAVCPAVAGLRPEQNEAVAERMRKVAEAAGMTVGTPGKCRPNALVLIAENKDELVRELRRKQPAFFYDGARREIYIPKQTGPAIAWQVEGRTASEGRNLGMDEFDSYYVVETPLASERIRPSTHPHFIASVVVIELKALEGLTTTQLADYAAMRVFARTDPSRLRASGPRTILTALEAPMDAEVPITLTELDLSFLKGLYASKVGNYAPRQRREIELRVRKAAEKAESRPN